MRIAFDARPLLGPRTGVGVWLEGLVRGLVASTSWDLVLALPRGAESLGLDDLGARVQILAPAVPFPGTLWLMTVAGPSFAGRIDALVGTLGVLPRRVPAPTVLVVHDTTPRTRPHHHTLANRFCFNAYLEESLSDSDAIVCVSAATRARLAAVAPGAARAAVVIGEGVDPVFSPPPEAADGRVVRERFADGRPFIVQIGTLEPRKGVATLVAAHGRMVRRRSEVPDLVLAGKRGWGGRWLERAIGEHPSPTRVHLPGYVAKGDAVELLRHAELVAVASEEEGFGLPLAEALACGAACVASDDPALVEVARGAAWHAPRGDDVALAALLEAVLEREDRSASRQRALARAAELGWAPIVARWRAVLEAVATSPRHG
jgi:glycosyltransferase involved in cell wall biosynthesis